MTTIYFVRHASSDASVHNPMLRPLTDKGKADAILVAKYFQDKNIHFAFSSPYQRAVDTLLPFTSTIHLPITIVEDFREHETISDSYPDEEYFPFIQKYWSDPTYKLPGDESIHDLQQRNIRALEKILVSCAEKNSMIGTHGMALSSILNFYDSSYGYKDFLSMVKIKPWIVKMTFQNTKHLHTEYIDVFRL